MPRFGNDSPGSTIYPGDSSSPNNKMYLDDRTMPEDGWITKIGIFIGCEASVGHVQVLYINYGLAFSSASRSISGSPQWITANTVKRASKGADIYNGVKRSQAVGSDNETILQDHNSGFQRQYNIGDNIPSNVFNETDFSEPRGLRAYVDYVANAAPSVGAWAAPTPSGDITDLQPVFAGTLPHGDGDGSYDDTSSIHLQIWENGTTNYVYDNTFAPTNTEKANNSFSRDLSTFGASLESGKTYRARFRHYDTFDLVSGWSSERAFSTVGGPNAPILTDPKGKLNVLSGWQIKGSAAHPNGDPVEAIEIRLYNASGATQIGVSDVYTFPAPAPSGSAFTRVEQFADLAFNTGYVVRARAKANGIWGPLSGLQEFRTNAFPVAPTSLTPGGGRVTGITTFSARVLDPDADRITAAEMELVRVSTNAVVGTARAMTVASDGTSATVVLPTSDFIQGEDYKWRARANDGIGWGAWSGYSLFSHAVVPEVTISAPNGRRTNEIRQPRPFLGQPTGYWVETARVEGVEHIDAVLDPAATDERYVWRVVSGGGDNRFVLDGFLAVDPARPRLFALAAWQEAGNTLPTAHFCVVCYDANGVSLGTVYPGSIASLQAAALTLNRSRYGGVVWPVGSASVPAYPAGTAQVKVEYTPSRGAANTSYFTDIITEELPVMATPEANYPNIDEWFGYADGATEGYGPEGHFWLGEPGNSASSILPVLTNQPASVLISHTATAKTNDRLLVEQFDGVEFVPILDSGWTGGARLLVPIPGGILRNEGRYRLSVGVREIKAGAELDGYSEWVEVEVRYVGPQSIQPYRTESSRERGEITVYFPPPTLQENEFAGIEVIRRADGEPDKILDLVVDRTATSYTDPYPMSGVEYTYSVRQLQVVGLEIVEGSRASIDASVDYHGLYFIKSTVNPYEDIVAFNWPQASPPRQARGADQTQVALRGRELPVFYIHEHRTKAGPVQMWLHDRNPGVPSIEKRHAILDKLIERRPVIAILFSIPKDRVFAQILGDADVGVRAFGTLRDPVLNYSATDYSEDYYARGGV